MRLTSRWSPRTLIARRADRFLLAQFILVFLALLLLSATSLAQRTQVISRFAALCQRTAIAVTAKGWMTLLLIPPLLIALSFMVGALSIWRQLRATRFVLRGLGPLHPLPSELVAIAKRLGLSEQLQLFSNPRPFAFCVGLRRPAVVLTTGLLNLLDQDALAAVLCHEGHHLRHRDPLKLLFVRTLGDAFFFLPLVRDLGRAYEVHKELAADAEASRAPNGQLGLARALIKLLGEASIKLTRAAVGPLMLGTQNGTAAARMNQLTTGMIPPMSPGRRSLVLTGFAFLLFISVSLLLMGGPSHARWGGSCGPGDPSPLVLWLDAF